MILWQLFELPVGRVVAACAKSKKPTRRIEARPWFRGVPMSLLRRLVVEALRRVAWLGLCKML